MKKDSSDTQVLQKENVDFSSDGAELNFQHGEKESLIQIMGTQSIIRDEDGALPEQTQEVTQR